MMILRYFFENFYSFKENTVVDFTVNKQAPDTDGYVLDPFGNRVTKILVALGPNASGKTHLLKVIPFLGYFIGRSFGLDPKSEIPFSPFQFDRDTINKPAKFGVEFFVDSILYTYKLIVDRKYVVLEELYEKEKDKSRKNLFVRQRIEASKSYSFNHNFGELPENFSSFVRENASVVSTAVQHNHQICQKIAGYWNKIQTNVKETGKLLQKSELTAAKLFAANPNLKEKAEKLLTGFDLGLSGFKIEKYTQKNTDTGNEEQYYFPVGIHNNKYELLFLYESSGTVGLFITLSKLLPLLERGGISVSDEFESDLHPHMIPSLVKLFTSKETNPHQAQLLFSCHYTTILKELDKYQVLLVEKNEDGVSNAWRLDGVKGVRVDNNIFAKYESGAYGAIPRLQG